MKKQKIDWEGKGDISQEIYNFVKERIEYWEDDQEYRPESDLGKGILLGLKAVLDFMES